ncbi:MAG: hypothetical protein R2856_05860 [Caldilineaceae bacterium]
MKQALAVGRFPRRLGIHGPYKGIWINAEDSLIANAVVQRLSTALTIAVTGATHMVVHSPFTTFGSPLLPTAAWPKESGDVCNPCHSGTAAAPGREDRLHFGARKHLRREPAFRGWNWCRASIRPGCA